MSKNKNIYEGSIRIIDPDEYLYDDFNDLLVGSSSKNTIDGHYYHVVGITDDQKLVTLFWPETSRDDIMSDILHTKYQQECDFREIGERGILPAIKYNRYKSIAGIINKENFTPELNATILQYLLKKL